MALNPASHWHPTSSFSPRYPVAIKNKSNVELADKFSEWLTAQRFSSSTHYAYTKIAYAFCRFIGERHLSDVDHMNVRYFLIHLMKRDLSVDGFNRHLYALRRFFDFLYMGGVVDSVTPRMVRGRKRNRPLPRVLAVSDVARLIRAAGSIRNETMLEALYSTGCRVGELVGIRAEDIDFARRTIRVTGKTQARTVFFGPRLKSLLKRHLDGRRKGLVFLPEPVKQAGCVYHDGNRWYAYWKDYSGGRTFAHRSSTYLGADLTDKQAWRVFRKKVPKAKLDRAPICRQITTNCVARALKLAAARAGMGRVTAHMLRHSFATHMLHNGANVRQVQELLGHSSLATTQIYTRIESSELSRAHSKFHPRS